MTITSVIEPIIIMVEREIPHVLKVFHIHSLVIGFRGRLFIAGELVYFIGGEVNHKFFTAHFLACVKIPVSVLCGVLRDHDLPRLIA